MAPEFTLPDAFGNPVSVCALLVRGPVVISFYRGEWCPFCNIDLRALQQALPTMEQLGVDVDYMTGRAEPEEVIATLKEIVHPVGQ